MAIAIIAEYNPFHNGHIYQLQYVKKNFPNDKIIIIMSGKYVQRGELAVVSFEERAAIAKSYGADEVYELAFEYATQAAHVFAAGAVKMIADLKIEKMIFGSESNDVENLILIAKTIKENIDQYNKLLKLELKQGFSFPKANANVLEKLIGQAISLPNDILGLEYVKVIIMNNYNITPYTLKRTLDFHAEQAHENFASASLIRKMIFNNEDVSKYTPMIFNQIPDRIENYYPQFQEIIRNSSVKDLQNICLVSEGIENLFKKHINANSYDEFVSKVNSKRYTSSRIKRIMLYILLNITKNKEN
ncbi:nucleotidyltransferase [Mycoplasma iguanae]|uniref:tRNA(Met) cytidine acetate ligase n=1 Tax=Mycoplasma iguanae TaxID=292461 RepID=A0ABY5R8U8_9MOLU|nr:nucleotidyltransferase [Mycoplasma iguanae]UVD81869.1 nucleotidyltransferase [Mycoplasma iguanae]